MVEIYQQNFWSDGVYQDPITGQIQEPISAMWSFNLQHFKKINSKFNRGEIMVKNTGDMPVELAELIVEKGYVVVHDITKQLLCPYCDGNHTDDDDCQDGDDF